MSTQERKNFFDLGNNSDFIKCFGHNEPSFVFTTLFMSIMELAAIFKNHQRLSGLGNRLIKILQDSEYFDLEASNGTFFPYINQILSKILSGTSTYDAIYFAHWFCDQEESHPYYARAIKAILCKEFNSEPQVKQNIVYNRLEDIEKYLLKLSKDLEICINYSIDESLQFKKCGIDEIPNIFLTRWSNGSFWVVYHKSVINFFTNYQESELDKYPFMHPNPYISAKLLTNPLPSGNPLSPVNDLTQANDSDSDSSSSNYSKLAKGFQDIELNPQPKPASMNLPEASELVPQKKTRPALNLSNLTLYDALRQLNRKLMEPRKNKIVKSRNFEKKIRPELNLYERKYIQILKFNQSPLKNPRIDGPAIHSLPGYDREIIPNVQNSNNHAPSGFTQALPNHPGMGFDHGHYGYPQSNYGMPFANNPYPNSQSSNNFPNYPGISSNTVMINPMNGSMLYPFSPTTTNYYHGNNVAINPPPKNIGN